MHPQPERETTYNKNGKREGGLGTNEILPKTHVKKKKKKLKSPQISALQKEKNPTNLSIKKFTPLYGFVVINNSGR